MGRAGPLGETGAASNSRSAGEAELNAGTGRGSGDGSIGRARVGHHKYTPGIITWASRDNRRARRHWRSWRNGRARHSASEVETRASSTLHERVVDRVVSAAAPQREEAHLRSIGLWRIRQQVGNERGGGGKDHFGLEEDKCGLGLEVAVLGSVGIARVRQQEHSDVRGEVHVSSGRVIDIIVEDEILGRHQTRADELRVGDIGIQVQGTVEATVRHPCAIGADGKEWSFRSAIHCVELIVMKQIRNEVRSGAEVSSGDEEFRAVSGRRRGDDGAQRCGEQTRRDEQRD